MKAIFNSEFIWALVALVPNDNNPWYEFHGFVEDVLDSVYNQMKEEDHWDPYWRYMGGTEGRLHAAGYEPDVDKGIYSVDPYRTRRIR